MNSNYIVKTNGNASEMSEAVEIDGSQNKVFLTMCLYHAFRNTRGSHNVLCLA